MTASEYIIKLHALIDQYGDLRCISSEGEDVDDPEFNDDDPDDLCFVLCDKA